MGHTAKNLPPEAPEGYLEKRDEMQKRDAAATAPNRHRQSLTSGLNRYFGDGVREYTKQTIAVLGGNDAQIIGAKLREWEKRGLLRIIRPFDVASDKELIIEMFDFIDPKTPWLW